MPVPAGFNYDMAGRDAERYYTVDRVHPPQGYGRPGDAPPAVGRHDYRMGAHHIDSWAMNTEFTGPIEVWGGPVSDRGLWDAWAVQDRGPVCQRRAHDRQRRLPNGIKFYGTKGWLFVSRGNEQVTKAIRCQVERCDCWRRRPTIIKSVIGPTRFTSTSKEQHGNWLQCVISRGNDLAGGTGHRACSTCLIHDMAMVLKRSFIGTAGAFQER
jgi:hypothetical protein